jgi:hypothetical protein
VGGLDVCQVVELGATGEAVGQDRRSVTRRADRGQESGLGDRDRDVVVAALDAEVARKAAAAADRADRRAGIAQ